MLKLLSYVYCFIFPLGSLAQSRGSIHTRNEGCLNEGKASPEYFDVCSTASCKMFHTCVRLDDGAHACFCDADMYSFMCGDVRLCDTTECNNAAQCVDAPDGSTFCACIPGTEGERCQYFTRKLGGDISGIQTRVTDGPSHPTVPWSQDVCWRVHHGQSIEIDIGHSYAVNVVKVTVFSDKAILQLATLGPGDTGVHLCYSVGAILYGDTQTFSCDGVSTRFLRLDVQDIIYSSSLLICIGGVVQQGARTGMSRYVPQSGRQQTTSLESPSVIHCAVTCMENTNCVTFTWDSHLSKCFHYEGSSASPSGSGFEGFSLTRTDTTGTTGC